MLEAGPQLAATAAEARHPVPFTSPKLQFRRELAGLDYSGQRERVRPEGPTADAPVQMRRPASPSGSIEEEARQKNEWKSGAVTKHVNKMGLGIDPLKLWVGIYKGIKTGDYSDFEKLAKSVTFAWPGGPLCLWSGAGTETFANNTGTSLNETALGKLLAGLTINTGAWPQKKRLWEIISKEFVERHAKGQVHVFIGIGYGQRGGIRPESVFGGTEKKAIDKMKASGVRVSLKYHCIVTNGSGGFKDALQTKSPGSVPPPRSLFWKTGKNADIGKTNPDAT